MLGVPGASSPSEQNSQTRLATGIRTAGVVTLVPCAKPPHVPHLCSALCRVHPDFAGTWGPQSPQVEVGPRAELALVY